MQKRKYLFGFSSLFLGYFMMSVAMAGVVADKSRIIFMASDREQGLSLVNVNEYPVMVQLWVDDGDPDSGPEVANAPILPNPGLLKLAKNESKYISLLNISEYAVEKQEQLYWLNLYEVPPSPSKQMNDSAGQLLVVALRTQMKVFIRPDGLNETVDRIPSLQQFFYQNGMIKVKNNSPYFVTYQNIRATINGKEHSIYSGILAPFSATEVDMPDNAKLAYDIVFITAEYVDDDGNIQLFSAKIE